MTLRPHDISEFQPDQGNKGFKFAMDAMEHTNETLFITGKAGTGKSTLLRHFIANTKKQTVVLAPTGIAAINVGGVTVHSFFRLPFRPIVSGDEDIKKFPKHSEKFKMIQKMDALIIDEVSMLRADVIDAIDQSLRLNMNLPYTPFGGKQLIFFGDLFQLEPVVQQSEVERYLFNDYYNSHYFFSAHVFKQVELHCLELKIVYRQNDLKFIELLDAIRLNKADKEVMNALNERVLPHFETSANDFYISLCARNQIAGGINEYQLGKIKSTEFIYKGIIDGEFNERSLPTDAILVLKEGAQVIFLKNDVSGKWANGTIAKVIHLEDDIIGVELPDQTTVEVTKETWENKVFKWDQEKRRIKTETIGTFKQFPLKLAWAITIHKSQGLTFDKLILELGGGAFAHGQLYVALSRCRTLNGIVLREPIRPRDCIVDERVVTFADQFLLLDDV